MASGALRSRVAHVGTGLRRGRHLAGGTTLALPLLTRRQSFRTATDWDARTELPTSAHTAPSVHLAPIDRAKEEAHYEKDLIRDHLVSSPKYLQENTGEGRLHTTDTVPRFGPLRLSTHQPFPVKVAFYRGDHHRGRTSRPSGVPGREGDGRIATGLGFPVRHLQWPS